MHVYPRMHSALDDLKHACDLVTSSHHTVMTTVLMRLFMVTGPSALYGPPKECGKATQDKMVVYLIYKSIVKLMIITNICIMKVQSLFICYGIQLLRPPYDHLFLRPCLLNHIRVMNSMFH